MSLLVFPEFAMAHNFVLIIGDKRGKMEKECKRLLAEAAEASLFQEENDFGKGKRTKYAKNLSLCGAPSPKVYSRSMQHQNICVYIQGVPIYRNLCITFLTEK